MKMKDVLLIIAFALMLAALVLAVYFINLDTRPPKEDLIFCLILWTGSAFFYFQYDLEESPENKLKAKIIRLFNYLGENG
jgi:hypothetical protein